MIRGGLRTRLVHDSVRFAIVGSLQQRGWFDPTIYDTPPGIRRHQPLRYIPRPIDWSTDIQPNAVAITSEDSGDVELALGGEVEDRHVMYVDIFAQDDPLGWQVAYDIRDSLMGRSPEVGVFGPQIDVYDFRQPTPAPFTTIDVESVRVDRAQGDARDWQRHWFMIYLILEDDYRDEYPSAWAHGMPSWTAESQIVLERIQEVEVPQP